MAQDEAVRSYLVDMAEQLAQLARKEGFTQGAGYFALAGMALRLSPRGVADEGPEAETERGEANRRAQAM